MQCVREHLRKCPFSSVGETFSFFLIMQDHIHQETRRKNNLDLRWSLPPIPHIH